jgi:preprotein translocase subunit SecD
MSSFELVRGFAEMSILGVIIIEVLVAAIYFSFLISDRRYLNKSNS